MIDIPEAAWTRAFDAPQDLGQRPKIAGQHDGGCRQGVPLGGFGTGGIGRDWTGAFRRWTLKTGSLKHFTEAVNGFACFQGTADGEGRARVLRPREPEDGDALSAWGWEETPPAGAYHGLFPKAWYRYPAAPGWPVEMVCEQFSPVLPNNYRETALPVGVFRWHLRNTGDEPATVGLLFSFANLCNWFTAPGRGKPERRNAGNVNAPLDEPFVDGGTARGVLFDCVRPDDIPGEGQGQMAIAARANDRIAVATVTSFDALGDGAALWVPFARTGALEEDHTRWIAACGFAEATEGTLGGALSATVTLAPGEVMVVPMVLVWDFPVIRFGTGRRYYRRYTELIGRTGNNAVLLAREALERATDWSLAIDDWHARAIADGPKAPKLAGMMLNELYLLVDGLTAWTAGAVEDGEAEDFFGLIECPDYPYYDTLDLWVYASLALAANWPEIDRDVAALFARQVDRDDDRQRRHVWTGETFPITVAGSVPHDLGAPDEDPVEAVNAFAYRDTNGWKDLNAQFIVTVCRIFRESGDAAFLEECYPAACAALEYLARFDRDGDGLIENDGIPDQTFDNIPMLGPGAYCGGLWLAALAAVAAMAEAVGDAEHAAECHARKARAAEAYQERLWTGSHFRIDAAGTYGDAVLIDQMFGPWMADRLGLECGLPRERIVTALKTVYQTNFLDRDGGRNGAVNIAGDPEAIAAAVTGIGDVRNQSSESLTAFNLSLAAQLQHFGLLEESEAVLESVHRAIYEERGLWFRTPAAWDPDAATFRAIMNMRPLVVWGMAKRDGR